MANTETPQPSDEDESDEGPPVHGPIPQQVQRRLPVEAIMALVRAYQDGASIKELTDHYRINRSTVLWHLDRNGVVRRGTCPKLTEAQVAEAARLREEGWSYARIGQHLHVTDVTVANSLRRAGLL